MKLIHLALLLPLALPAQRSQFLITKGKDMVAVELFSRTDSALTSEIYQPNGPRVQFTLDLKRDSTIQHVELTRVNRAGQSVGISLFFLDTVVKAALSANGESQQMDFPSRKGGATPFLANSFALLEQIVRASHLAVGKSTTMLALRLGAMDTASVTVTRFHADSVLFALPGVEIKAALDASGKVIGGRHVQQDWIIQRVR